MNQNPESPTSQPKKSLLVPIILGVAVGATVLGLTMRRPGGDSGSANSTSPAPTLNQSMSGAGGSRSGALADAKLVVFVPDNDGALQKRTLPPSSSLPSGAEAAREALSAQAVRALMAAAPDIFPPKTALNSIKIENSVASLDFNKPMGNADFYTSSALATAAMDALTLTVESTMATVSGGQGTVANNAGVRILVEGTPLKTLGPMDLREPYEPSSVEPAGGAS